MFTIILGLRSQSILFIRRTASTKAYLYQKCYAILKVSPDADQETVRGAYIGIVKTVHPDSGHADASAEKFAEVDNAFRLLQGKFSKERHGTQESPEVENHDIRHTAPQHRQYLSYDGVGIGSPAQRERQYQQSRASKAYGRVVEYRVDKLSASSTDLMKPGSGTYFKDHAIKTKYGFDRVVEDLIQEAMSKGEFTNLEGSGKPLTHAQSQNPYVDFTQHKINKILLDNGFTPEWITTQKEIRTDLNDLNRALTEKRAYFGKSPLGDKEMNEWMRIVRRFELRAIDINRKIDKYNLIVPILDQQMCQIQLEKIAQRILYMTPDTMYRKRAERDEEDRKFVSKKGENTFLSLFKWWS